jgi:ferredoxin
MKVIVDLALCVGHARCEAVAPSVYSTDNEEGKIVPIAGRIAPELEERAVRGARACPERAITIMGGKDDSDRLWPPQGGSRINR